MKIMTTILKLKVGVRKVKMTINKSRLLNQLIFKMANKLRLILFLKLLTQ
jgi:hypothetical protein